MNHRPYLLGEPCSLGTGWDSPESYRWEVSSHVCGLVQNNGSRKQCLHAQTWAGVCLLCLTSPSTPVRPGTIMLNSLADMPRLILGAADLVPCGANQGSGWVGCQLLSLGCPQCGTRLSAHHLTFLKVFSGTNIQMIAQ